MATAAGPRLINTFGSADDNRAPDPCHVDAWASIAALADTILQAENTNDDIEELYKKLVLMFSGTGAKADRFCEHFVADDRSDKHNCEYFKMCVAFAAASAFETMRLPHFISGWDLNAIEGITECEIATIRAWLSAVEPSACLTRLIQAQSLRTPISSQQRWRTLWDAQWASARRCKFYVQHTKSDATLALVALRTGALPRALCALPKPPPYAHSEKAPSAPVMAECD